MVMKPVAHATTVRAASSAFSSPASLPAALKIAADEATKKLASAVGVPAAGVNTSWNAAGRSRPKARKTVAISATL
jgi:hypothetical protein